MNGKCTCGSTKRTIESHAEDCGCRSVILTTGVNYMTAAEPNYEEIFETATRLHREFCAQQGLKRRTARPHDGIDYWIVDAAIAWFRDRSTNESAYDCAKRILWDCAGMTLKSDMRITMEPETFIGCIKAALMSHNLTRPDAHVKNSEGNERDSAIIQQEDETRKVLQRCLADYDKHEAQIREKDRVIREMAEVLGQYARCEHTLHSQAIREPAQSVLTNPANAAVIAGAKGE